MKSKFYNFFFGLICLDTFMVNVFGLWFLSPLLQLNIYFNIVFIRLIFINNVNTPLSIERNNDFQVSSFLEQAKKI